jgi:hypothetical protein
MANTAWSATDKSANITLTGSNLIATNNNNANGGVRAADKQITGKFYWEVTCNTIVGTQSGIGVCSPTAIFTTSGGFSVAGAASVIKNLGQIYVDGVLQTGSIGALTAGSLVCIAVDCSARLIWFRLGAAGNWNNSGTASPATGAGGFSITSLGIGIPLYPATWLNLLNDQVTANFGDSAFTGAVPAGFTSGFVSGVTSPTNALATQSALEQFLATNPPAQVTQVTIEQWATTATVSGQAMVTQVALEQWVPAARPTIDLAGNLGGVSQYGKLKYGKGHYSRIDAFAPLFAADLTLAPVVNLAGGLVPTIVLAADLDVHVNLIDLAGGIAPQIALEGALSLLVPLDSLLGSFGFEVVYGASSFISGPLWADTEPCPTPPWVESEPCPPPAWMITAPCEPVVWGKTRLCNG